MPQNTDSPPPICLEAHFTFNQSHKNQTGAGKDFGAYVLYEITKHVNAS